MSILVLGSHGQVGRALMHRLAAEALARPQVDYACLETILPTLDARRPRVVINAAAYTQVDRAESDRDAAHRVNADLPAGLADWCARNDALLVHFSTDYVYPGTGTTPWLETAPMAPVNEYGRSKAAGDAAILASGCRFLLFRTSWVYDAEGQNFVRTMLRLFAERDTVSVVADQFGAPTYAPDLAQAVVAALQAPPGIYNACNAGETTWFGFAEAILAEALATGLPVRTQCILPLSTDDWKGAAPRSLNSRLDCSRLAALGIRLRSWREALHACLEQSKG